MFLFLQMEILFVLLYLHISLIQTPDRSQQPAYSNLVLLKQFFW